MQCNTNKKYTQNTALPPAHLVTAGPHHARAILHRESKKGATLSMAITLSILGGFAKFFHCCKEQYISNKLNIRLPITP